MLNTPHCDEENNWRLNGITRPSDINLTTNNNLQTLHSTRPTDLQLMKKSSADGSPQTQEILATMPNVPVATTLTEGDVIND